MCRRAVAYRTGTAVVIPLASTAGGRAGPAGDVAIETSVTRRSVSYRGTTLLVRLRPNLDQVWWLLRLWQIGGSEQQ